MPANAARARQGRSSAAPRQARRGTARPASRGRPYSREEIAARRRDTIRPRLLRPVAWIALVAVLLTGVVVLNVTALRERMESDRLSEQIAELRDDQRTLEAQLAKAGAYGRIEFGAKRRLGLVPPTDVRHVKLPVKKTPAK